MATAKSLKRLRSASSAFLEDGGSLLHGVDGLLQDIQQTLVDLQRREEVLVERELALEDREACLNAMLKTLADNVSSLAPVVPTALPTALPTTEPTQIPVIATEVPSPSSESKLANELADIQSTVAEAVSPDKASEALNAPATTASTQRFSNHRKKRRR